MFGFLKKRGGLDLVEAMHARVVEAARDRALYGDEALPDTLDGRFEALVLHALVVLRRLKRLPAPAGDVAQDFVDTLFAYLEVALRETGVGDFGVPKRMKKLATAFYDRASRYDPLIEANDLPGLADAVATKVGVPPGRAVPLARGILAREAELRSADLAAVLAGPFGPALEVAP
ncbi:MAG: ubiquinol-cytochrome C chaperone [Methylobacteriaceae bacterium]|nr:ubiquinol-cytochrome C chaperone [Methylobacteriaceae bacterium]